MPKFLMKRWAGIDADNVHLATLRVYDDRDAETGKQRIVLILPESKKANSPSPENASTPTAQEGSASTAPKVSTPASSKDELETATEFDLEVVQDTVDNQIVVAEKEKAPGGRASMLSYVALCSTTTYGCGVQYQQFGPDACGTSAAYSLI
jgi:transcription initiation factor TFIIF subunit beta